MRLNNNTNRQRALVGVLLVLFFGVGDGAAQMDCSGTVDVTANFPMNDHYFTDSALPCFKITGTNVVFNGKGKETRCQNTSGACGTTIKVEKGTTTIKNVYIVSVDDDWGRGVDAATDTGGWYDTDVTRIVVENAAFAVKVGGSVTNGVFTGITGHCVSSGLIRFPAGMLIKDNFCQTDNHGMVFYGPTTGADVDIEQNYVQAANSGILPTDWSTSRGTSSVPQWISATTLR